MASVGYGNSVGRQINHSERICSTTFYESRLMLIDGHIAGADLRFGVAELPQLRVQAIQRPREPRRRMRPARLS